MLKPARRFAELPISVVAILDELERRADTRARFQREQFDERLQALRTELSLVRSALTSTQLALQHARNELQAQAAEAAAHDPRSLSAIHQRLGRAFTVQR